MPGPCPGVKVMAASSPSLARSASHCAATALPTLMPSVLLWPSAMAANDVAKAVSKVGAWAGVDINILCHPISAGAREPSVGAHVTVWFLRVILSPPVMVCQAIDVSGPQHFNSGCRDLSSYQQSMSRSAGTVLVENSKTT